MVVCRYNIPVMVSFLLVRLQIVTNTSGFEFVNEGTPEKQKKGFVATVVSVSACVSACVCMHARHSLAKVMNRA